MSAVVRSYRATHKGTGEVVEYDGDPVSAHLTDPWCLEEIVVVEPAPDTPVDTRVFGGRRQLTKLEFVSLLGDDFTSILTAAKQSVAVEAFVMMVTLATPDSTTGYAIDLDDPRMQALLQLEALGVLGEGRAQEILNA